MTLEQIIKMLKVEYAHAVSASFVKKPLSYALYQTWKYVSGKEREK